MRGVWARAVLVAVAGTARASLEVDSLEVEPGTVTALVGGCVVTLDVAQVPPRIWAAMTSYARGRGALEDAVAGRLQSSHLSQLLADDWDEPLIPHPIRRSCTCDAGGGCEHVAAAGLALADEIDRDPGALLLWRGCVEAAELYEPDDPWQGRAVPSSIRCASGLPGWCCSASARAGFASAKKSSKRCSCVRTPRSRLSPSSLSG